MNHLVNRILAWALVPIAGLFMRRIEPGTLDWEDQ